ncbi:class I SAM-dependent methyltransferase [Rhizorhabdus argentea]|uniref:class I SAM-dependent methyltransferase n=1 Tax=Rhizorhabdus argentea TaxID=1387174 RepID=UPI0030EDA0CD
MAVTREDVVSAYRLILGREPESEFVIEQAMLANDIGHLRAAFMGSPEFVTKYERSAGRPLAVGRLFEVDHINVDIQCNKEQLQEMFDRIAKAWRSFGETEPHWSVLVSDDYRQENLSANIDRFYASGHGDIKVHLNFLRRAGLPVSFKRALDFGCGVGRLTLALAPHAQHVLGIDISPPHLRLAAERAGEQSISNVEFEVINSVNELGSHRDFDFIISRIVLQHNPPPVMAALYRSLLQALAPGGVAVVQIPTFLSGQSFSTDRYLAMEQPSMEMNAIPQKLIFEIIEQMGCRPLEVREDGAAGDIGLSHTFAVQRVS